MDKPTMVQVTGIFKDIFLWAKKNWKADSDKDWENSIEEARLLNEKYPFNLTRIMLVELLDIIEFHWKERKNNG